MTVNAQTILELADDIADIPHEVNLTPRQARLLQEAANRLRETAALSGKPGAAQDQLSQLRQAILDNTQGDGFWIGEILLAVLAKETGFNGSVTRPNSKPHCIHGLADYDICPDCAPFPRPDSGGAA